MNGEVGIVPEEGSWRRVEKYTARLHRHGGREAEVSAALIRGVMER